MKRGILNIGRHALALNLTREHLRLVLLGKRPDPNGIRARYEAIVAEEKRLEAEPGFTFRAGERFDLAPPVTGNAEAKMRQVCRRDRGVWLVEWPFNIVPLVPAENLSTAGEAPPEPTPSAPPALPDPPHPAAQPVPAASSPLPPPDSAGSPAPQESATS